MRNISKVKVLYSSDRLYKKKILFTTLKYQLIVEKNLGYFGKNILSNIRSVLNIKNNKKIELKL